MVRHARNRVGIGLLVLGASATIPGIAVAQSPADHAPLVDGEAWIVFQRPTYERDNAHAITLIRPDGSDAFFAGAAIPGGEQLHPDWSPDGKRIVLDAQDTDGTYDIWILDTSDWSAKEVVSCDAPCLWVQEPAWSPDGSKVAFQRHTQTDAGEVTTMELLDVASGELTTVHQTDPTLLAYAPRWSPDGGSLVFEQGIWDGTWFTGVTLEVLDLANLGATRTLVPAEMFANNSDWSSDGSLVSFSAVTEGTDPGGAMNDVFVVAPDGSGLRQVTNASAHGGTALKATFTPDGTRIVFLLTDPTLGAEKAMASIAIDGTDLKPLVGDEWMFGYHARVRPTP